jgi:RNA polymerase sigma-70 factor (ECF subfamily)
VHAAAIFALCRRMTGDEVRARELVQDVFVRGWERLITFRGQSAFATWLHRLGVNVVLEHLRTSKRETLRLIDGDDDTFGARSFSTQVDAKIDLDAALQRLPAGARTVFVLYDMQGYSHEEIAQMTGIAPGTARAQLWRARRALMRMLDA